MWAGSGGADAGAVIARAGTDQGHQRPGPLHDEGGQVEGEEKRSQDQAGADQVEAEPETEVHQRVEIGRAHV